MAQAMSVILNRFGGARSMSRALGKENNSTVQYWAKSGLLPRTARRAVHTALCATGLPPKRAQSLVDAAVLGVDIAADALERAE